MISLWDVLKASKGLPVSDFYAAMWGKQIAGKYTIAELEGALPLTFNANGEALIDYRIYGNTEQTGTPTPENPIIPIGCGERTENLFNGVLSHTGIMDDSGTVVTRSEKLFTEMIPVDPESRYAIRIKDTVESFPPLTAYRIVMFDSSMTPIDYIPASSAITAFYFDTEPGTAYLMISFSVDNDTAPVSPEDIEFINLVKSSEAPSSYIPYGYKLPILSNSTVTNIYLGQVETTRRIKKLVLTGEEIFTKNNNQLTDYLYYSSRFQGSIGRTPVLCNELPVRSNAPQHQIGVNTGNPYSVVYWNFGAEIMNAQPSGNTVAGLKEYLAAQYAAGTPVTVWYVLAEPETGIVNEPLMKIGNYADTISMEQAGVSIPTNNGSTVIDYDGALKPSQMYIKYLGAKK